MEFSPGIRRLRLLAGAHQAQGVAVVIDVLRAFSSAAYMLHLGAERIILCADPQEVLDLRSTQGCLAVGEVDGVPVPGFDLGNSPSHILDCGSALFAGRTVALRTSAGVTGAVAASQGGGLMFLGSYLTASSTAQAIRCLIPAPETISLIAMGDGGREATPDDDGCSDYLEHLLGELPYDHAASLHHIVTHGCAQKFLRGDAPHYPPDDLVYCLQRDLFSFAIVAASEEGYLVGRRFAPTQGTLE
jgi:2-phosphosulfolactate phosphatase